MINSLIHSYDNSFKQLFSHQFINHSFIHSKHSFFPFKQSCIPSLIIHSFKAFGQCSPVKDIMMRKTILYWRTSCEPSCIPSLIIHSFKVFGQCSPVKDIVVRKNNTKRLAVGEGHGHRKTVTSLS